MTTWGTSLALFRSFSLKTEWQLWVSGLGVARVETRPWCLLLSPSQIHTSSFSKGLTPPPLHLRLKSRCVFLIAATCDPAAFAILNMLFHPSQIIAMDLWCGEAKCSAFRTQSAARSHLILLAQNQGNIKSFQFTLFKLCKLVNDSFYLAFFFIDSV